MTVPTPPLPPAPPLPAPSTSSWLRAYHGYGRWLAGLSWWHFALVSLLLLVSTSIAESFPPFSWPVPDWLRSQPSVLTVPAPPAPPRPPGVATPSREGGASATHGGVEITIGAHGVVVRPAGSAASGASGGLTIGDDGIEIKVPPGADSAEVRQAIEEARDEIKAAIEEAREAAAEAGAATGPGKRTLQVKLEPRKPPRRATFGDSLAEVALLWIFLSAVLKITYQGRLQAEAQAARSAETAEAETLKRQVVEARMAAMQAQVEPHFLFNTLASIDHLIETDPPRASAMQKHLIALLRASMPTMREAGSGGLRELGREIDVIVPYLEILKVRMEERLATRIEVPEGLRSATFPPMMIQSLVENAIKHGLEPKPEGGTLAVRAEIVHGKLAVSVTDTGVGFGKAPTAGTGIGLDNIRERLALLYGGKAALAVTALPGGGTQVTITVPYAARDAAEPGATP